MPCTSRVFIDPGHGGEDTGAAGNGLQEKDIALDLAVRLAKALEQYNCRIMLSRHKDVSVANSDRIKAANDWGADLYFSVHVNGHTNVNANGYEDYVYPSVPQETADIRKAIHRRLSAVWFNAGRSNRGMKTADFQVLRETKMSAVLVENGFITNPQDAGLLRQVNFRQALADAMAAGIAEALGLEQEEADTELEQLRKENRELQQELKKTIREMEGLRDKLNQIRAIIFS